MAREGQRERERLREAESHSGSGKSADRGQSGSRASGRLAVRMGAVRPEAAIGAEIDRGSTTGLADRREPGLVLVRDQADRLERSLHLAPDAKAARGEAVSGAQNEAATGRNGSRASVRRAGAVKESHSGATKRRGSASEEAGRRERIRGLISEAANRLGRGRHLAPDAKEAESGAENGRNGSHARVRRADLTVRRGSRSALKATVRHS
jgi:hypothetical protein